MCSNPPIPTVPTRNKTGKKKHNLQLSKTPTLCLESKLTLLTPCTHIFCHVLPILSKAIIVWTAFFQIFKHYIVWTKKKKLDKKGRSSFRPLRSAQIPNMKKCILYVVGWDKKTLRKCVVIANYAERWIIKHIRESHLLFRPHLGGRGPWPSCLHRLRVRLLLANLANLWKSLSKVTIHKKGPVTLLSFLFLRICPGWSYSGWALAATKCHKCWRNTKISWITQPIWANAICWPVGWTWSQNKSYATNAYFFELTTRSYKSCSRLA